MPLLSLAVVIAVEGGKHERRLLKKLREELEGWNVFERPSEVDNSSLKVEMGLTLQQIIDVVRIYYIKLILSQTMKCKKVKKTGSLTPSLFEIILTFLIKKLVK